jgi:hypothetical protein
MFDILGFFFVLWLLTRFCAPKVQTVTREATLASGEKVFITTQMEIMVAPVPKDTRSFWQKFKEE